MTSFLMGTKATNVFLSSMIYCDNTVKRSSLPLQYNVGLPGLLKRNRTNKNHLYYAGKLKVVMEIAWG